MTQVNGNKPVTGKDWRKLREEGFMYLLPSAEIWVRLRPVALDVLMLAGKVPDTLTPLAASVLWEPRLYTSDEAKALLEKIEAIRERVELINIVCRAGMAEPRIVDDPQYDDEISPDDLDFVDKFTIYQLVTQPAGWLHRFRAEQTPDVELVPDDENDMPAQQ